MKIQNFLITALLLLPVQALSLPIVATPTDTVGPLRHNVFHDGGDNSSNGAVLAWFDLDAGQASSYDPVTGELLLHVLLFSDSTLSTVIGSAIGTGTGVTGFGDFDDSLAGSISWVFADGAEVELGIVSLVMSFIDHNYAADSSGNIANSFDGTTATLWGADGTHNGDGLFTGTTLGVDMSFVIVPEPSILVLIAIGILGFGFRHRKN